MKKTDSKWNRREITGVVALAGLAAIIFIQGLGLVTKAVARLGGRHGVSRLSIAEGGDTPKKGGKRTA